MIRFFQMLLLFFILTNTACSQSLEFEYQGIPPEGKYMLMDENASDISPEAADNVLLRNRVYIDIDTLDRLYLNTHPIEYETLSKHLRYVLKNPDRQAFLPESLDEAVIFINFFTHDNAKMEDDVKRFKRGYALQVIVHTYFDLFNQQIDKKIKDINPADVERLNMLSTPKIAFPMFDDESNRSIEAILPDWAEEPDIGKVQERNIFKVKVNDKNEVFVQGEKTAIVTLKSMAKEFIMNPKQHSDLAESPRKAIISLQNDRGTSYKLYLEVYNELKAAYEELWDELAQQKYGRGYTDDMPKEMKKAIRGEIPFVLSEAEPTDLGTEEN